MEKTGSSNLLGARVPVVVAELVRDLLLDIEVELSNAPLKIYDLKNLSRVNCVCCDGVVLFEGCLSQEIYYVGFLDSQLHYQLHRQKIEGLCPNPLIKKGMVAYASTEIQPGCSLGKIKDDILFQELVLLRIKVTVCRYETIHSSSLVTCSEEFPVYYKHAAETKLATFVGKDAILDYTQMAEHESVGTVVQESEGEIAKRGEE